MQWAKDPEMGVVQRLLGILEGLFQRGCLNNATAKSGGPLCALWRRAPD